MKIEFLIRREVQDGSGTVFEAGKIYDLPDDSANHWLSRGVAIETKQKPKQETATATESKPAPRSRKKS